MCECMCVRVCFLPNLTNEFKFKFDICIRKFIIEEKRTLTDTHNSYMQVQQIRTSADETQCVQRINLSSISASSSPYTRQIDGTLAKFLFSARTVQHQTTGDKRKRRVGRGARGESNMRCARRLCVCGGVFNLEILLSSKL